MALQSKLFAGNARLLEVLANDPAMRKGETGQAVALVQVALVRLGFAMPITTAHGRRHPDGIYGAETEATVRKLQARHQLVVDGITGKYTLGKLDALMVRHALLRSGLGSQVSRQLKVSARLHMRRGPVVPWPVVPPFPRVREGAGAESGELLVTPEAEQLFARYRGETRTAQRMRPLSGKEIEDARVTFGDSVDYGRVFVSSDLGLWDLPWTDTGTFAIEVHWMGLDGNIQEIERFDIPFNILNVGKLFQTERYLALLRHEMTHVWQSQHHPDPGAYLRNSRANWAIALARGDTGLAYEVTPGKRFQSYSAEQIAELVEARDEATIRHIRSVPRNTRDAANEASLSVLSVAPLAPLPGLEAW